MGIDLPSVFVGSSTEGLDVAREIELQLQGEAEITIWKDGVFQPGSNTLESLIRALHQFDFAVLVLSPDDTTESRGATLSSPRDNVLFELGLFMGHLGRDRVFIVHEQNVALKLPSDLAGITLSPYRKRENLTAALSPTCTPLIKRVRALGRHRSATIAKSSGAEQDERRRNDTTLTTLVSIRVGDLERVREKLLKPPSERRDGKANYHGLAFWGGDLIRGRKGGTETDATDLRMILTELRQQTEKLDVSEIRAFAADLDEAAREFDNLSDSCDAHGNPSAETAAILDRLQAILTRGTTRWRQLIPGA
jgi:predicted nucleotide-binding protein